MASVVSGEEERSSSKHKLARGLFKMTFNPACNAKPNPTASFDTYITLRVKTRQKLIFTKLLFQLFFLFISCSYFGILSPTKDFTTGLLIFLVGFC